MPILDEIFFLRNKRERFALELFATYEELGIVRCEGGIHSFTIVIMQNRPSERLDLGKKVTDAVSLKIGSCGCGLRGAGRKLSFSRLK